MSKRTKFDKVNEAPPESRAPLRALTEAQGHYILSIKNNPITFGIGPAGTGKTAVAVMSAADAFLDGSIERIIITRPIVEVGDTLGFLPGTVEQKHAPYLVPIYAVLESRLGRGRLEYALKAGQIEATPLELMRGQNFDNCWVLLDEAQNTTIGQMKMFLTRIGRNAKVLINGDIEQIDIEAPSGLTDALNRLQDHPQIGICEFTWEDVVRSPLVKTILRAYAEPVERRGLRVV
jgi:phosphate starvation-inducible PhoH-like protein